LAAKRAARQTTRSGRKIRRTGTIAEYNARRDFKTTAEPKGERAAKSGNRFVVQKHDATRLHFDLRLEHDGVLKSWAVTRGPSLVPGDKRLAVQTEDHPLRYLDFEGVIPKGEYGGGTMILWDRGTWAPDGDAAKGFKKGHLHFTLKGKRLKGAWHLVRMRAKPREKRSNWLLIKSDDEAAQTGVVTPIVEAEDSSIKTGRTNADLEKSGTQRADHKARRKVATARAKPAPRIDIGKKGILPGFVEPELATLVDHVPESEGWLHEIKLDGYRVQARIDGGKVQLFTRKGLDWTKTFKPVAEALKALKIPSALIDGEIVVEDESGRSDFSALQQALKGSKPSHFLYRVFDLLYANGRDLRSASLIERKEALEALLADTPADGVVRYSGHIADDGASIMRHACRLGLEGVVSKRAASLYRSGRGRDWLKIKCTDRQELIVAGYVPSRVAKSSVGSLVVALHENGELVHVGRVGTGYTAAIARDLAKRLRPLEIDKPPFKAKLPRLAIKDVRWVKPELVAEVELRGFTSDGIIRHAAFKGLRDDKDPEDVVRETAKAEAATRARMNAGAASKTKAKAKSKADSARGGSEDDAPASTKKSSRFPLTHPDRVYWPDIGLTKLGLAEYYDSIAALILPHIVRRPIALMRCPTGTAAQCFFQKHGWDGMPKAIRTIKVDGEEWVYIDNKDGLIGLVQSGSLEIHPWGSTVRNIEKPDRIILDFDPGPGVSWEDVIAGAFEARERLKQYGLQSFVKTTGGKGLHVVAPLTPRLGWDEIKDFTRSVAEEMAADARDRYTATMSKKKRTGRIFIDYLRNGRGSTAVAAFSTRAREGAPVSTPVAWNELGPDLTPNRFTVENVGARLDNLKRDPWAGFFALKQTIRKRR